MMPAACALFTLAALGGLPFGRGDRRLFLTLPALGRSAALAALVGGPFRVPFGTLFLAAALGGLRLCLGAALSAASAAAPASASPAATALTLLTALLGGRRFRHSGSIGLGELQRAEHGRGNGIQLALRVLLYEAGGALGGDRSKAPCCSCS